MATSRGFIPVAVGTFKALGGEGGYVGGYNTGRGGGLANREPRTYIYKEIYIYIYTPINVYVIYIIYIYIYISSKS